jgi:hypothetical protein
VPAAPETKQRTWHRLCDGRPPLAFSAALEKGAGPEHGPIFVQACFLPPKGDRGAINDNGTDSTGSFLFSFYIVYGVLVAVDNPRTPESC